MTPTGRVALVTGANRGIGRAIAAGLAAQGIVVAIGARSPSAADAVAAELGAPSFGVRLDVTDAASVEAAVAAVVERTGRIDIVVNNAGGHYDSGVVPSGVSDADVIDAIEINLVGPWRVCRAAIPHMQRQGRGRIVNVSSRSGTFASTWADAPAYGVSKAALNMMTFQLAKELEGSGILVNACCPGWVRTDMGGLDADKSPEEGADTPIWLATLPDDGPTGGMFGERARIDW
ncbi:MAG: SDR family NAD(P)-dependent oxidoreductase [Actinobacteria bacterium]|nr:SDR family NAD(P)-dependent oxidoreductase [Actinomycetota bacterium]